MKSCSNCIRYCLERHNDVVCSQWSDTEKIAPITGRCICNECQIDGCTRRKKGGVCYRIKVYCKGCEWCKQQDAKHNFYGLLPSQLNPLFIQEKKFECWHDKHKRIVDQPYEQIVSGKPIEEANSNNDCKLRKDYVPYDGH